ncbi:response regulator, partial [bacterium]|nr:response regulator [bacterium]
EETAKTAKVEELIPTGGNERILLVDDESVIASLESEMLERLGYNVTSMTNSLSALEFFNTHPNDIDLLITDMRMPGISGIQLASHFLSIRPDIPIIICSGFSESIDQQSAKIMGIKEILMKPLTFNQFAGAVRKALDKKIQVTV